MFRCVVKFDAADDREGSGWFLDLVEGTHRVSIQVITDDDHLFAFCIAAFHEAAHFFGPVYFRLSRSHGHLTPCGQWFGEHENVCDSGTSVFVVDSLRMVGCGRNGSSNFLDQLHGLLVHAQNGNVGIERSRINGQNVFHVRGELGIGFRRDHPVSDATAGVHLVFFSVRQIV